MCYIYMSHCNFVHLTCDYYAVNSADPEINSIKHLIILKLLRQDSSRFVNWTYKVLG